MSIRENHRKKALNRIDPVYIFLDRVVFKPLFNPSKMGAPGEYHKLEEAEVDFLVENLAKHRFILWLNLILTTYLILFGLDQILAFGNTSTVVTGLLAPAMITGAAWYAVSFGGIPEKFVSIAFLLTLAMFLSFTMSMTLLTFLLIKITPWFIGYPIILPIYLALYLASLHYDNVDGLKIGLDSTLLKFSRAAINYYQKYNLITPKETQKEAFGDELFAHKIANLAYYIKTLERNINQLEEQRGLRVANGLIASSLDILFNILDNSNNQDIKVNRGDSFELFLNEAYNMSQLDVDKATKEYLNKIVDQLDRVIGEIAHDEIVRIKGKLNQIQLDVIIPDNLSPEDKQKLIEENQHFSDHVFSQTFRSLLELISAYRHILLNQ